MDEKLLEKATNGDIEARNKIVMDNMRLVYKLANKYTNCSDINSLIQEGVIGFIKAFSSFDKSKGSFLPYAYVAIKNEMIRFIIDKREDRPFRIKRNDFFLDLKITYAEDDLAKELHRIPSLNEVAEYLNIDIKEVSIIKNSCNISLSLFDKYGRNDKGTEGSVILDIVEDTSFKIDEGKLLTNIILENALNKLEGNEKQVIELMYIEHLTQKEIGKILNFSQSHICRIKKRALKKMKDFIAAN